MADGWHLWLSMMALKAESTFTGLIGHNTGKCALAWRTSDSRRIEYVVQKIEKWEKKRTSQISGNLRNGVRGIFKD